MIYDSILGTIGNTPVVRINRLAPAGTTIYVKCEAFNPMSSVKDRLAIAMIEDAERRGVLKPGTDRHRADVRQHGDRPRDGLRGEGLPLRRDHGRLVLGGAAEADEGARREGDPEPRREPRVSGMVKQAKELADKHGWFLPQQFENPSNPEYHRNTTGPEILRDFAGKRLDYFVSGSGTGGTITGAGEILKAARPEIKIIFTEPAAAPMVTEGKWAPHKIQGWTTDFVPAVLNTKVFDEAVLVTDVESRDAARALAQKEGIFCGISSGATFAAARQGRREGAEGLRPPRDAPRHRRAVPLDDTVRGNYGGQ